jgi:hypothetical protein
MLSFQLFILPTSMLNWFIDKSRWDWSVVGRQIARNGVGNVQVPWNTEMIRNMSGAHSTGVGMFCYLNLNAWSCRHDKPDGRAIGAGRQIG